ncbi:MAG: lactonase family protein [Muribaculaceae bacterium]|nr:lactonase family protein [Muribaculaceae bacterium]
MLNKLRHIKGKLLPSFAILAAMLTGCINDDSMCPPDKEGDDDGVTIEFKVITRDLAGHGTRALVIPSNTLEGTMAENYLDLDNTTFLLFDESKTLIKVFVPYVDPVENTHYAKYSVRAFMSPQEFHTLTGDKTNVTFSIAVVGNFSRLNPQNAAYHIGQKLEDIFDQSTVATFQMPISNNNSNDWRPSIYPGENGQQVGYIPMAGIQTYTIPVADLAASTVDHPLDLSGNNGEGDINMLRALAKIEIIDRIDAIGTGNTTTFPDNRMRIEKVELVGHTTRGSFFPNLNQWNSTANPYETQYVTAPSIPTSSNYMGASPVNEGSLTTNNEAACVNFFADATATDDREDKCGVFSCYLTEYNPTLLSSTDEAMWIRLTCQYTGEDGQVYSEFYRLDVAPYVNGSVGASMPILRNNIYRYEITGIRPDLELQLVVNNWTSTTTEWDFDDVPGMTQNGYLVWESDYAVNPNYDNATIVYRSELTGLFTFAQPLGGTWNAVLALGPNTEVGSFVFVDKEGNEIGSSVSGDIDGNLSTIRIKATQTPSLEYDRSVRVLFTVNTPDGRTITANVLGNDYGDNKYITIIQEKAL